VLGLVSRADVKVKGKDVKERGNEWQEVISLG
jgi:hypothetical protein